MGRLHLLSLGSYARAAKPPHAVRIPVATDRVKPARAVFSILGAPPDGGNKFQEKAK